jgi:malate dehydrogenase
MNAGSDIPAERWFAMTRLDENRAKSQLAQKAGVHVSEVSNMCIWGNHSATQYPDYTNAKIGGVPAVEKISDEAWLRGEFISTVQKRGAAIIEARGLSSAASAANGVVDTVKSLTNPTPEGDWTSVCVCSDGAYGVDEGLISSFPIRTDGVTWEIVRDVTIDQFSREKIDATVQELREEREAVAELLP